MKISMRVRVLSVLLLSIVTSILVYNNRSAWAEQVGSSPESGTSSRIKTIYDSLSSLSHGSDSAGVWGDWGVMWNRIRSAAEWVPNGNLDTSSCLNGKTFYSADSRSQKICTGVLDGSICTTTADCMSGTTCTTFYQDSDGDLLGNSSVIAKACGPTYTGYVTDNTDANDSQACASGANPTGTCNKCVSGAIANQTSAEDVFSECAGPSLNACSGAIPVGPNGLCGGSGSCDATSNTATACATAGTCQTGGCSSGSCVAVAASPVGTSCGGGVVAYVSGLGGLIAATSDQSTSATWGCYGTAISGADGTAIGTGHQNTHDMAAAGCTTAAGIANAYAGGGYTDWFIPSKDELAQLYANRAAIGGFAANYYWSSSEYSAGSAWAQTFSNGGQANSNKNSGYYLRVVRVF